MPSSALIMGVIGHVDHGKTALVRALTGIETDRLPEERRRGISIALGFAHLPAGDAVIDLIDMPGHERFVRTMIAGATGIAAVLLVVAANEGIKPQTVEHAEVAALLGVRNAIAVVSKCDLVAPEQAAAVAVAAGALAARLGLAGPPPLHVSAVEGTGLPALKQALVDLASHARPPADRGVCYLPIDRAFTVAGHGTVVTGTLRGGAIASGDEVELAPTGRRVRVRGLQVRGVGVPAATPGQRVAVNLRAVDTAAARPGLALAAPGLLVPSSWLTVELRAAPSAPSPLAGATKLRLLFGTSEADATLRLLDRAELAAAETCFAQLRCVPRVAVPVGERVVLRLTSPLRVVAGGRVLDAGAQRLRRADSAVLDWLALLARETHDEIVRAALARAGARGASLIALARLAGVSPRRAEAALRGAPNVLAGGIAVAIPALDAAQSDVLRVLERATPAHPRGLSRDQLRAALPGCGSEVLDLALARLAAKGRIERTSRIRLIRVEQEQARKLGEDALAAALAESFRRAGLSPPTEKPADVATRRALDRLVREGVLVRAPDRVQKREILFHQEAIDDARRRLRALLATGPGLLVGDAGAALGISRKYSVPLLEHLDAIQFTRRVGDRRLMRENGPSP
jgi:selenocysteine-specific elongation factor